MNTPSSRFSLQAPPRAAAPPASNVRRRTAAARTRTWQRLLALACCGALPAASLRADTAYWEDFVGGVPEVWSGTNLPLSQAIGTNTSSYLGQLGNDTVTLMLDGLNDDGGVATPNTQGQHTFVTVSYDLFVIGGWTGNNASTSETAHTFAFQTRDWATLPNKRLTTTFSNIPAQIQTFPFDTIHNGYWGQRGGKGANEINTLGFSGAPSGYNDAVYRLAGGRNSAFTFDHAANDLTLDFSAANLPAGATWGITNVKIATGGVFSWQALDNDGLNGGWDVGGHWVNPNFNLSDPPGPDDLALFTEPGSYDVSIHADTSVGFLHYAASNAEASTVRFNTTGHTLTLTAGNSYSSKRSIAVSGGPVHPNTLFFFNSNPDDPLSFNGVINAETVAIDGKGALTLDGYLDPDKPGTNGNPLGNVTLNVQREMDIGDATLNILFGAILNSGLSGGSASSNAADDNTSGFETQVGGTVNVNESGMWNQTGSLWCGVNGPGKFNVTKGSQINIFKLPFAGQLPAIGGDLKIGGFAGSSGVVTVKDPDSAINAGDIQVANLGVNASLMIADFGVVNAARVAIGADIIGVPGNAGVALVDVTHQGLLKVTTPDADGSLTVGDALYGKMNLGYVLGNDGSLFNTGQATVDFAVIGRAAHVLGEVNVAYAQAAELHSLFTINKTLTVGDAGIGRLFMNGGGVAVVLGQDAGGPICVAGSQAGSQGVITMGGGTGSDTWAQGSTFDASAGAVVLGDHGFGRLEMVIGGQAFAESIIMARQAGATAEVLIDGDGSDNVHTTLLKVSDPNAGLEVGRGGTSATVELLNGGLLDTFRATVGGQQDGEQASGTVMVRDLRNPATLRNPEIGSLWLVHGVESDGLPLGGTLDIGGNPLAGPGLVTIGSGGRLGVENGLQLKKNGRLNVSGGAVTVGTADPLLMATTPNSLRIVANTTLPNAFSTVSGEGVITADVMVASGGNLSPNGMSDTTTGSLSIVGSLRALSGSTITIKSSATSTGSFDTIALGNAALTAPAGTAILDNGALVTLMGLDSYTPTVGDFFDVLTAAKVIIGTLILNPIDLPSSGWHYGVVSIPGGQALRLRYGAAVQEPGSVAIRGTVQLDGTPVSGFVVTAIPGFSALTDASGQYSVAVPMNSTGTVTPSASGLVIAPTTHSFTNLTVDLAAQDFLLSGSIAPTLAITATATSGSVAWTGIVGVTYQPETSTNLVNWTAWGGPLPGTNGPASVWYQPKQPKRFFRVRCGN